MPSDKEFLKETEAYDKKDFATDASIQDALMALGVYVADIDPNDCREDVRLLVDLAQEQPQFKDISEDKKSTEKRVNYYIKAMQDPDQLTDIIDRAVRVVPPELTQRVVEWMESICNATDSTDVKIKKLNEIKAKLKN